MIFPWQTQQWQQLIASKQQNRLPHALLLSGLEGVGKKQFAESFAHNILCKQPQNEACQTCQSCRLLQAGSHPDFLNVFPDKLGGVIKIDQIREVVNFVNETAQQGGYKVIIINPANAMNIYAANALLKTLEEPSINTLFILITNQSGRLLPTIKSRCQRVLFSKPEYQVALEWLRAAVSAKDEAEMALKIADGAPLKAKAFIENNVLTIRKDLYSSVMQQKSDPIALAAKYQDADLNLIFELLLNGLQDLLRYRLTEGTVELTHSEFKNTHLTTNAIFELIDQIRKAQGHVLGPCNLNKQLMLEELFVCWRKLTC